MESMGATRSFLLRETLRCAEITKGLGGELFPDRMWRFWGPSMSSGLEERLRMSAPYLSAEEENALKLQGQEEEEMNTDAAGDDANHPNVPSRVSKYSLGDWATLFHGTMVTDWPVKECTQRTRKT